MGSYDLLQTVNCDSVVTVILCLKIYNVYRYIIKNTHLLHYNSVYSWYIYMLFSI